MSIKNLGGSVNKVDAMRYNKPWLPDECTRVFRIKRGGEKKKRLEIVLSEWMKSSLCLERLPEPVFNINWSWPETAQMSQMMTLSSWPLRH